MWEPGCSMPMHTRTDTHDGSRNYDNAPITSHKLGQSLHKTRYFNNAVSVTTLCEKHQNTGPQISQHGDKKC